MSDAKLALAKREVSDKKVKVLREQGLIPSVVFGEGEPILTQSTYNETEKAIRAAGYHSPIDLSIDGKAQMALVKVVDMDPVKRVIRNIEFQAISANEVVEATAPIKLVGFEGSDASKAHLVLSQVLEEINIKAKPANLPEFIEVDASKLATVEDGITIADVVLPKGVEFADKELDSEQVVASLYDPAAEAEKREAEAQESEAEAEVAEPADEAKPEADTNEGKEG